MSIWRYLDRLPVGPHGGGIIIVLVLALAALLFGAVVLFS